ncbi:MAG: hypothetical protein OEL83_19005 [Desulforhopalus sp.]|nr:hypothetical protein [Desulforhopalus sp.]
MIIYQRDKNMPWNLDRIRFLYPPDDFTGSFANAKMQERHKALQDQKIKVILDHLEGHSKPLEAMQGLHPLDHLQFLHNNLEKFRQAGDLEKTVLLLYLKKNTPFAAVGDYAEWKSLLLQCDPARLYAEGKPFPFQSTTAYRGSMTGNPLGLSWSVSREDVDWFLERWQDKSLGGGTIFAMEITKEDILLYKEDEKRQEVLLRPDVAENRMARVIDRL